jgi:hypothetical protein
MGQKWVCTLYNIPYLGGISTSLYGPLYNIPHLGGMTLSVYRTGTLYNTDTTVTGWHEYKGTDERNPLMSQVRDVSTGMFEIETLPLWKEKI